jgi:serine/threonine protein kinase
VDEEMKQIALKEFKILINI